MVSIGGMAHWSNKTTCVIKVTRVTNGIYLSVWLIDLELIGVYGVTEVVEKVYVGLAGPSSDAPYLSERWFDRFLNEVLHLQLYFT